MMRARGRARPDRPLSASSRTSFRAPSIWPSPSLPPVCRSASAASMSRAASPCCPRCPKEMRAPRRMGVSIFAGEAEELPPRRGLARRLCGQAQTHLQLHEGPALARRPAAADPVRRDVRRTRAGYRASISAAAARSSARSAPSSMCRAARAASVRPTISRSIVRENARQGITAFFITDDNFARNKEWESLFDRLIQLREEREDSRSSFTIQVDTLCHRIPNFIEKAAAPASTACSSDLRTSIPTICWPPRSARTRSPNTGSCCRNGAIMAPPPMPATSSDFPADTKESILRDIEIIKRELPIDLLEFFFLTPLPGSEDHKTLLAKGVWMDADLNKYDLNHRVTHHPRMMSDRNGKKPTGLPGTPITRPSTCARSCAVAPPARSADRTRR